DLNLVIQRAFGLVRLALKLMQSFIIDLQGHADRRWRWAIAVQSVICGKGIRQLPEFATNALRSARTTYHSEQIACQRLQCALNFFRDTRARSMSIALLSETSSMAPRAWHQIDQQRNSRLRTI